MSLLITIPAGVILELLLFFGLRRLAGFSARAAAGLVALFALAAYVPYMLLEWPGADVASMHIAVYLLTAYALGLTGSGRAARAAGEEGSGFQWAPAAVIGFFAIIILFDGVLVVVSSEGLPAALTRALFPEPVSQRAVQAPFPGVVPGDYQKKEALYNDYLAKVERQRRRGWQVRKGWLGGLPQAGEEAQFQVAVTDASGGPLSGARVQGVFIRPADRRLDQPFELAEVEPGLYRGSLTLDAPGRWDLLLRIERRGEVHEVKGRTEIRVARGKRQEAREEMSKSP